jgi:hypothetical protein
MLPGLATLDRHKPVDLNTLQSLKLIDTHDDDRGIYGDNFSKCFGVLVIEYRHWNLTEQNC